jgi:DNA-binding IclR family transcriptional regulator
MTTPNDEELKRALKAVKRAPICKAQLAKQMHVGKTKAARLLEILHVRGLIDCALDGQFGWRYATHEAAERIREQSRIRHATKNARKLENARKNASKRARLEATADDSVDTWPILRLIVPAHETKITKRGPASVWELAA